MPAPVELRDFHALPMARRNTYKGKRARMPEIAMSRILARNTFIYFLPWSLLLTIPLSLVTRIQVAGGWAAPGVGLGALDYGDARVAYPTLSSLNHKWQSPRSHI